jgi:hypothetical protein
VLARSSITHSKSIGSNAAELTLRPSSQAPVGAESAPRPESKANVNSSLVAMLREEPGFTLVTQATKPASASVAKSSGATV